MRHWAAAMMLAGLAATPASAQWKFQVGDRIEADPAGLNTAEAWVPCRVLELGPGAGNYKLACALPWAKTGPMSSEGYAPERRMRVMTASPQTRARTEAAAARFQTGQTVLASPAGIEQGWTRCVVRDRLTGVAGQANAYKVECVNAFLDHYGRKVQTVSEAWAKENWMKPDQPGFHPEWQLANARAQTRASAARSAQLSAAANRPRPNGPATAVRPGSYECWANGSARMNMNFTVTGAGSYRNESGAGRFALGPGGQLKLTGPMLESIPAGFVAVYHEPGGKPTVSFRSPRGAEAAFCERSG